MKEENRVTNRVIVYPVPKGAVLQQAMPDLFQNDFCLRVRAAGAEEWQELRTFRVKVDMHDVRAASMAYFDFCGKAEVEITFPRFYTVYKTDIRPLSLGIQPVIGPKRVTFYLEKPADLSIEINGDRFHNLHLFAGAIEEEPDKDGENVLVIKGSDAIGESVGDALNERICAMPKGRLVYIEAGIHYIGEYIWHLPSDTDIYMEGGAILKGALVCDRVQNIHISGRGMLHLAALERFSGTNGIRISHSSYITVENLIFINPPHYTVCLGGSRHVLLRGMKSFSCEGWSDGIDMMSCQDITADGGFLRTSDDCVAIYGSRWDNWGDSRNITIKNLCVWADVAHPLMIGTHGDSEREGDMIENILFENIDILEHHEYQAEYLGAMAINAGDKNTVRSVIYRDIRIEPFEHGKVLDFQIKWNRDYNPAPGSGIRDILLERIFVRSGSGEEPSVIRGYDETRKVRNVRIRGYFRDGKQAESMEEADIRVEEFTEEISLEKNI